MMLIWFCRAHDLILNINAQVLGAASAPDPWTNASADCSHRQACNHALATLQSNCCPQVAIGPNDPMTPCHPASKHRVFKLKRVWTMLPRVAKAPEIQTIKLECNGSECIYENKMCLEPVITYWFVCFDMFPVLNSCRCVWFSKSGC